MRVIRAAMMRPVTTVVLGLAAFAAAVTAIVPARAGDEGPVIVIPSRPGIPVVINGRDASYAVVEGDWGLARPGFVSPTIIGGSLLAPSRVYNQRNSYHPKYGTAPERGRHEIEPGPDRRLPEQAESFSRDWTTPPPEQPKRVRERSQDDSFRSPPPSDAADVPATIDNGQTPFNPPIIVAPKVRRP